MRESDPACCTYHQRSSVISDMTQTACLDSFQPGTFLLVFGCVYSGWALVHGGDKELFDFLSSCSSGPCGQYRQLMDSVRECNQSNYSLMRVLFFCHSDFSCFCKQLMYGQGYNGCNVRMSRSPSDPGVTALPDYIGVAHRSQCLAQKFVV